MARRPIPSLWYHDGMTTTRHDIHRPSLADPADYEYVGAFYQGASEALHDAYRYDHAEIARWQRENPTVATFDGNHAQRGTCDHCGAAFHHGVLFLHVPTNELVSVGHVCASNTIGLPSRAAKARKDAEERAKLNTKVDAYRAENPDVYEFLVDAVEGGQERFDFVLDVARKLRKYGELSERQTAAIRRIMEQRRRRQAERDANPEPTPEQPLGEGRYLIEGEIVSAKIQDGIYGPQTKMLVKLTDGNKVWGTCPASVEDASYRMDRPGDSIYDRLTGLHVRFTAQVTRSEKDEHFGFFKRPTGAAIVEEVAA